MMHDSESLKTRMHAALALLRKPWVMAAGIAVLLLLAGVWSWWHASLYRPIKLATPETVDIRKGTSLGYAAKRLQQRGIIPSARAFKLYARFTGQSSGLKVGEYEVTGGMRPVDVLRLLTSGHARLYRLTIPEGKWASETAELVKQHWPDEAPEFARLVNDPAHWQAKYPFLQGTTLEGYLFPDTYRITVDASAEQIITTMLNRFQTTCWAAYQAAPPKDGRTFYEVLTLASLVEAEAKKPEERPTIAGVYMNRLRKPGWSLDCDAALMYAKGIRVKRLYDSDKLIDSPYNTYPGHRVGLPPGPINNPGLDAFRAALAPADVPYFFYVARGDGSHIFSRTLPEQTMHIRSLRGNN